MEGGEEIPQTSGSKAASYPAVALYNKLNKLVNVCTKTYLAELLYMWSSLGLTYIMKNESAQVHCFV